MSQTLSEDDPWAVARLCCEAIGDLSNPVATCVRLLNPPGGTVESGRILPKCPATVEFDLLRLLRVRSIKAKLYYARRAFDPQWNIPPPRCSDAELVEAFSMGELRLLLALITLYRKIGKKADTFYWPKLAAKAQDFSELGLRIAEAFPSLGTENCLLGTVLRPLALGALSAAFPEQYKSYSRHLLQHKLAQDVAHEQHTFGCTHGHVGALLLQAAGFTAQEATLYFLAVTDPQQKGSSQSGVNHEKANAIRAVILLADSLMNTGGLPEDDTIDSYRTSTFNLEILLSHGNRLRTSGSATKWLDRSGADLDRAIGENFT